DIHQIAADIEKAAAKIKEEAADLLNTEGFPNQQDLLELSSAFARLDQPAVVGRSLSHSAAQKARAIGEKAPKMGNLVIA
ncbi:MAG: hypothetical protein AAF244_05530, partial [Pseudomonadota bacterium]